MENKYEINMKLGASVLKNTLKIRTQCGYG